MNEYLTICDISRHNGEVNMVRMKEAGAAGVVIRATIGDYYTDPRFYENWRNAEEAGLNRTAYHVVRPESGAKSQMARFLGVVGQRKPVFGLYGWVMDCEVKGNITNEI